MARHESIISLDPIDRNKKKGLIGRLLITRHHRGIKPKKSDPFGHYMFCGPQRSGKTASAVWYAEYLAKKYKKKGFKIRLWSNFGIGNHFKKEQLFDLIDRLDTITEKEVRIFLIDEVHTYFPRDGIISKEDKIYTSKLNTVFSQLAKRSVYVLSTAQIYGRLDKALREQCLYMIDCKIGISGKFVNDFIEQKDILADDLGRWSGDPKFIHSHGLSTIEYDTKRLIKE